MSVYTPIVMGRIDGFDWDAANVGHVLRHSVRPSEVEETVRGSHVLISAETIQGEERWKLLGRTAANRYLVVVFTIRRNLFRTITAYPMNAAERRKYATEIK
jgi:uncharacterized DUF497 family protein